MKSPWSQTEEDWDSYGAYPTTEIADQISFEIADMVAIMPEICATPEGGILIYWRYGDSWLQLFVRPNGDVDAKFSRL